MHLKSSLIILIEVFNNRYKFIIIHSTLFMLDIVSRYCFRESNWPLFDLPWIWRHLWFLKYSFVNWNFVYFSWKFLILVTISQAYLQLKSSKSFQMISKYLMMNPDQSKYFLYSFWKFQRFNLSLLKAIL